MAERSSSVSDEKCSEVFQVGNDGGKASKSKKRRRRRQKKQKLPEQTLENVQAAESSVLSTAECSESNPNFEESAQNSGEHEGSPVQAVGKETTAELDEQDSGVLEANAPNSAVPEGKSDSRKDSPIEGDLVTGKGKKLSEGEGTRNANDDGAEGKGSAEDKSTEQKETGTKKKKDLLSFGRSKKNKTQSAKKVPEKASGEKNRDAKESVGAEGDPGSRIAKFKSSGKENEQGPDDIKMTEPKETSAMKQSDNSPEDSKTVENNEGQIGEHERAQETDAAGSNKAKKFKPLASFRRLKKKADAPKSASAEENTGENAETKQHPEAACDDEESDDKLSNDEDDEEKTESKDDTKKKSTGKKFAPLRGFRRSKASKKSAAAGSDSAGTTKEKNENSQEKDVTEEEKRQDSEEHDAQQSAVSEECTAGDNSELVPEEEQIQDKCSADVEAEAMTPTKKEKKKGLLRRQMKKMWSTSGKTKEASSVEMAKENVADEGSGAQGDDSEEQKSPQSLPNPPAEASSEERDATEQEESEPADSATTAEKKTEEAGEMSLEAALIEGCSTETHATEKAEKTAGLFGRQIKKIKPLKKRKEENETKKVEEEDLKEKCSGASDADKEITKQVKRKKSGFQKISNALKKKKSRDEGWQNEDQAENEGLMDKERQETDHQTASAEVSPTEEEQQPLNHDAADDEDRGKNDAQQSDQEETEKPSDSEECPSEEEELSVERQRSQGASAMEAYKAHGNLMKPVIQELLAKMAKIQVVRASAPAEPEVEPEEDSEFTKTSDDYSLTEVTSTIGDSSPSFTDSCNDGKDSAQLEEKLQETNVTEENHDEISSDDTKVEESSECVPSTPEAEQEKPSPDETTRVEISTCDADGGAVITSVPEEDPNATETEPNGKREIAEDVGNEEIQTGSKDSEDGDNEDSEASQDGQEREMAKSEDLDKSGVTSNLDSSQTAPSRGRKEDWILVNHLEISQELSHQLKVLALDNFDHGPVGCCSMM